MRRRGFLGALAAAVAATKVGPVIAAKTKLAETTGVLASGVAYTGYQHEGVSITMPDDEQPSGYHTQHLGENGRLVAVTYPDGTTHLCIPHDVTVRRSLGIITNDPNAK